MAAFIAICGVPKGCGTTPSGMLTGMFMGEAIGTGEVLIGAGASTGVAGEEGVAGEAATAHAGGSGSAA